jgi:two-component system OmpR family response regulator
MNVLIIEEDSQLAEELQSSLELEGHHIFWAQKLQQAFEINQTKAIELVVLDMGPSQQGGLEFVKKIREHRQQLPVMILSSQTDDASVVEGLQIGASDYLKKPFGQRELLARIKMLLKEERKTDTHLCLSYGDLEVFVEQRLVKFMQKPIEVNRREFDILCSFIQRPETILSRDFLMEAIKKEGEIFDRTIDSHISHLRSRLKDCNIHSIKIAAVYGLGYRLEKKPAL